MQTVAGAQQQFYQFAKIQSACLFPLKMPSLKNPDPGSLCKKWGVRVRHVDLPPVLAKKTFCATTQVVPFFSGNSKGDVFPMICSSGGSKSRLAKAAGAEPAGRMRDEKLHAVVVRSTFRSQNVQSTPASDHFC